MPGRAALHRTREEQLPGRIEAAVRGEIKHVI